MWELLRSYGCVRVKFSRNWCGEPLAFVQGELVAGFGRFWKFDEEILGWVPMF